MAAHCEQHIPEIYRKRLGPNAKRYEPVLTRWIVDICDSDIGFRTAFVQAILEALKISVDSAVTLLRIDEQFRAGASRADIIIRDDRGKHLIVVEAKVNDPVKGFQLQRYRDIPELKESRAIIVSLARIGAHDKLIAKDELVSLGVRFLHWPEILQRLQRSRRRFVHPEIDQFFSFCACIKLDQLTRTAGARGPTWAEHNLLTVVKDNLAGWDCEPAERPDNISSRLRLGRPEWKQIFGPNSYKRLLIYYDLRGKTGPPNIHFQVILFSRSHHQGSREQCAHVLHTWLNSLQRFGLQHYGPRRGRRANTEDEKLRTEDTELILSRDFWVTDDLNGQTQVNDVSPHNVSVWMPKVLQAVGLYDRLVSTFSPADFQN